MAICVFSPLSSIPTVICFAFFMSPTLGVAGQMVVLALLGRTGYVRRAVVSTSGRVVFARQLAAALISRPLSVISSNACSVAFICRVLPSILSLP
jgi:hypothetical protein